MDLGGYFLLSGWRSEPLDIAVRVGGAPIDVDVTMRDRGDVAAALRLQSGANLGFTLVGRRTNGVPIEIAWAEAGSPMLDIVLAQVGASEALRTLPDAERIRAGASLPQFSTAWQALVVGTRGRAGRPGEAVGSAEGAAASTLAGGGVVSGWLLQGTTPSTPWIETSSGAVVGLDGAVWRERGDVVEAYGAGYDIESGAPGFALHVPGVKPGETVRLRTQTSLGEIIDLGEVAAIPLPEEPRKAAAVVLAMGADHPSRYRQFVDRIARPVIDQVVAKKVDGWARHPVRKRAYGVPVENPRVAVIVPLYGRLDFVENQLIEFSRDAWFRQNAELVYVVDDPRIADRAFDTAASLEALYRIPMTFVWGGTNRGFSGANNLGAASSTADLLLFLNSDVFPRETGWLETLREGLLEDESVGAIAPRLVFADGSIQHARMVFRYRDDLELWVNHHPYMGLDPALDPAGDEPIDVPAVTGACLLLRRSDFDDVGGWDDGYLIGDFEDSDLCLKLRTRGKRIRYAPTAELTHLERQSFASLGDGTLRQKIVMYNAMRHQDRWKALIEKVSRDR